MLEPNELKEAKEQIRQKYKKKIDNLSYKYAIGIMASGAILGASAIGWIINESHSQWNEPAIVKQYRKAEEALEKMVQQQKQLDGQVVAYIHASSTAFPLVLESTRLQKESVSFLRKAADAQSSYLQEQRADYEAALQAHESKAKSRQQLLGILFTAGVASFAATAGIGRSRIICYERLRREEIEQVTKEKGTTGIVLV